ncbi:MAG: helix-turn-helix transcriptional regulator [Pseudomonadales bacterium]|nr:helix-turn-helix transcriptional regulator [Pseudomonadales bacterium]
MSNELKAILGQNLIAARTANQLTQSELAERANISRATIAEIESGTADPRLSTLIAIADALNTRPIMLLLDELAIRAAQEAGVKNDTFSKISKESIEKMKEHLESDDSKGTQKAAQEGIRSLGVGGSAAVGAAIGSVLLPGIGTIIGATLGATTTAMAVLLKDKK